MYYVEIDCTQLKETGKSYAQDLWVTPPGDSFTNRIHDPISKAFWGERSLNPPRFAKLLYDRATSNEVSLSSIVDDVCSQVGLTNPADINTAALTDNVIGKIDRYNPQVIRQYKKGGKVKAKRKPIDGIAKSGKTRAKHRKDR